MAKALTVRTIETLKPSLARREIPDGLIAGLYLVLQPSGRKSWAVRYRAASAPRKLTLGTYPAINLKNARELASRALVSVAAGSDPAGEKKAAGKARPAHDLVEKVIEEFIERYARPNTRDWRETRRMLIKDVAAAWRGRRLPEIGRHDVHRLLDAIRDRGAPVGANRTFAQLRKLCSWAVERGIIEGNPCDGIQAPSAEKPRDRVLNDDELRLIWQAADKLGWPFGPIVKLLILTGQRRSEIGAMRWAELDFDNAAWLIPVERSKNRRQHSVPLSPQALAILQKLPRITGAAAMVFSSTGTTPPSGFSHAKARLDRFALANGQPIAPFILHDIRRSVASGMAGIGIDLHVIERVLNHVSGTFAGIVGVYQRHSFADEKRAAMQTWARHVESIVTAAPAENAVSLRHGA
jgi:integrase